MKKNNKENLIQKYHLTEAHKRMQQLFEYSFNTHFDKGVYDSGKWDSTSSLYEDDDDMNGPNNQPPMGGNGPQQQMGAGMQGGGMAQEPQMGGGPQGGNMPPQGGQMGDTDMGGGAPGDDQTGNEPPMGGGPDDGMGGGPDDGMGVPDGGVGGGASAQMDAPPEDVPAEEDVPMDDEIGEPPMGDEPLEGGDDEMQPGDEVIDVDQLTSAQEETDEKVSGVDKKLSALVGIMSKYIKALDQSNAKIEDLRAEFERRNPTDDEKMNIRSQASTPYTTDLKDFWREKQSQRPNYNIIMNNDIQPNDEETEYTIKRKDLDNVNDRGIMDTFDLNKSHKLKEYLSF